MPQIYAIVIGPDTTLVIAGEGKKWVYALGQVIVGEFPQGSNVAYDCIQRQSEFVSKYEAASDAWEHYAVEFLFPQISKRMRRDYFKQFGKYYHRWLESVDEDLKKPDSE